MSEEQTYYWNGTGTLGNDVKKGDKIPKNMIDERLNEWLKDGTVTTSEPDMTAELQGQAELLRIEVAELTEKNAALQGISKKLVETEAELEKSVKKCNQLESIVGKIQKKVGEVVSTVCQKLEDDSMSRKEKNEAADLLKGLING